MNRIIIYALFAYNLISFPILSYCSPPERILEQLQQEIKEIIEIANPSVVTISLIFSQSYQNSNNDGFFSFFRNKNKEKIYSYNSICSGLIYNKDGYLLTKNAKMVEVDKIKVTLNNGETHTPVFIGRDIITGLTVLKIDAKKITPAKFGDSDKISMGSWVTIIGNSMGISPTISFGIVNKNYENRLFEVSANIKPGNNGSPIFDIYGNMVGVLLAQTNNNDDLNIQSMFHEGGIALPSNKVKEITDNIIKSYIDKIGWLGIQVTSDSLEHKKIILNKIVNNSPAFKAGLKKGDVLFKYNNITINNSNQLGDLIRKTAPGATVPISFKRGAVKLNVFVTVELKKLYNEK